MNNTEKLTEPNPLNAQPRIVRTPEQLRNVVNISMFAIGVVAIAVSLGAEILGLDITPGFGLVQMAQLLVGLTLISLAGFVQIHQLRQQGAPRSLQADVGVRLGATGLVLAYVSGLADVIGIGTHVGTTNPQLDAATVAACNQIWREGTAVLGELDPACVRPFVGTLQLGGIGLGIILITAGMLLYYTSRGTREVSFLEFLIEEQPHNLPPNGGN